MLGDSRAFASFSVDDAGTARTFYEDVLGLDVEEGPMEGLLGVHLGSGATVMVYAKGDAHQPATFTVLHFAVEDLAATVDGLAAKGVTFARYPDLADVTPFAARPSTVAARSSTAKCRTVKVAGWCASPFA